MFHIKDDFAPGAPVSTIPAEWFNQVARFLNHFVGNGIQVDKPDKPSLNSPVTISPSPLNQAAPAPAVDGFPWGSQWCFGLALNGDQLTIYNGAVLLGTRLSTLPTSTFTLPASGQTSIAVVIDSETLDAAFLVSSDDLSTIVSSGGEDSMRIPLFLFSGRSLAVDYIHGLATPLVWSPSNA